MKVEMMNKDINFDLTWSEDIHKMATQVAKIAGFDNISDYLAHLVNQDAIKNQQAQNTIKLENEEFDRFIDLCDQPTRKLSDKMKKAAEKLDQEGLTFKYGV